MRCIWLLLLLPAVLSRPPMNKDEWADAQIEQSVDYLDDLLPYFYNSTKFKENLLYEKKKYLSQVLGQHRLRKFL